MKEVLVNGIMFRTDCSDTTHLQMIYKWVVESLDVLGFKSLDEIKFVVYKTHKVVNVIPKPVTTLK